jgi:hypothetical protein
MAYYFFLDFPVLFLKHRTLILQSRKQPDVFKT